MYRMVCGTEMGTFPILPHLIRAYSRWEEDQFPEVAVRCGVSSSHIQHMWGLGMSTTDPRMLRDCAAVVFSFTVNGLRESSVLTIKEQDVSLSETTLVARLSVWKGKRGSQVPLVSYHRLGQLTSPLDPWLRWQHVRRKQPLYFGMNKGAADHRRWCTY